ncbi:MAG TPA: class I SAM-dependent methyltransferase [Rhodopila sp.]|jgi:ubiquinone/menaquinone biosynthesis C-methylase UbiE
MAGIIEGIRGKLGRAHVETPYYEQAEAPEMLEVFWSEKGGPFFQQFQNLDLSSVVELACGRGRHTQQFIARAGHVTLVDINRENIEACRQRFARVSGSLSYVVNDGASLSDLRSESHTAVFSYDAMVHFEATDVIAYVYEIARVLKPGGRALLHYSNNQQFPEGSYEDCPRWRNFFSESMMRHFASRAGLRVLSSLVIPWPPNWAGTKDLDAVTLLQKPS